MRRGFSFVELMIVLAVIGILAALVVPQFQSHASQAKEAAAKNNLQIMRAAIELYTTQHRDIPPGYPNGDTSMTPLWVLFAAQMVQATNLSGQYDDPGTPGYPFGPYMKKTPPNPFNGSRNGKILTYSESFPPEATGTSGWIYKPATKMIRLDWPGTDKKGVRYYDY